MVWPARWKMTLLAVMLIPLPKVPEQFRSPVRTYSPAVPRVWAQPSAGSIVVNAKAGLTANSSTVATPKSIVPRHLL